MKGGRVNWDEARNRLRASERALEEVVEASPERIESIYRQRAILLAKEQAEHQPASSGLPVLVVRLAQERYAIELSEVAEVVRFAHCTPVPGAPPRFLGVINLHGELRSVLDLGSLLVPTQTEASDSGFVLALRCRDPEIGLKVDDIEELREIRPEGPDLRAQGNYLKRITYEGLPLLDTGKVLAGILSQEELVTT
jgi:chemotaxis signal transduction protein